MWRSVVDATAQSAASRLAAAEEYRRLIGQASRSLRNAKDIRAKRVRELHTAYTQTVIEYFKHLGAHEVHFHYCNTP